MPLVFFYGTLARDGANHGVVTALAGRFVREDKSTLPRTLVDLGPYPALLAVRGGPGPVYGEVFEVTDDALLELDELEGVPDLYTRESIALEGGPAATYVLASSPPPDAKLIPEGRYTKRGVALPDGASADQFAPKNTGSK